ncbi:hypothetical protein [Paracidobacterium acidisoli]|uniref:Uncharacterized protein n=1 Tax=Paracidobacterium acidisoli TaxID=2303751 RepID=A0A372IMQ7_9BACT|nr:hypothetical protein [Paracidobacterium acidisoli]MBT9331660.1 hypothetical protein [Paracidobacterium acidisoli]
MAEQSGTTSGSGRFENFGRRVDEQVENAVPRIEEDLKKLIAWLNDEVVPEVRRSSSKGLRTAAEQLERLAAHLDRRGGSGM